MMGRTAAILAALFILAAPPALAGDPGTETGTVAERTGESAGLRVAVMFRRQPVFFIADDGSARAQSRAERLSDALQTAIESPGRADRDAPNAEVELADRMTALLSVRGYTVGELFESDARAAGFDDLESYARSLEEGLRLFVADQRRRAALQGVALQLILAITFAVLGLLVLRLMRYLFRRADEYLDVRSASIRPVSILGVPIIGAEVLSAATALGVTLGRILAYAVIVTTALGLALSQFDAVRPWVGEVVRWGSGPLLAGLEEIVLALPRLALAAILVVAASGGLRVARILFDEKEGVSRAHWRSLTSGRARVLRIVASLAVILIVAPLAVAAVFGRFHTPLEFVLIAATTSLTLALVPMLASGVVGLTVLWRGKPKVGDRISVHGVRGRVLLVTPWEIELQGDDAARVSLPMLTMLLARVLHGEHQTIDLHISARRKGTTRAAVEELERAVREVSSATSVTCLRFDQCEVDLLVRLHGEVADAERLLLHLSDFEASEIEILGAELGQGVEPV